MAEHDLDTSPPPGRPVRRRGPELAVALGLCALAGLVLTDSLRVGHGWADDGPESGYFPFYVGLLLLGAAAWIAGSTLWRWRADRDPFADTAQLRRVAQVLLPLCAFIAGMAWLGLYVSSIALIGFFMRRHGRFAWHAVAAVALGVPFTVYAVFERWFLVLLPKGPLERLLGL